jgi:hypothetical protein
VDGPSCSWGGRRRRRASPPKPYDHPPSCLPSRHRPMC